MSADWLISSAVPRQPKVVRVTMYDGVELPHVEIWGEVVREDGTTVFPHVDLFRPVTSTQAERLQMLDAAEVFIFKAVEEPTLGELRERAENMRGRILLAHSRGTTVHEAQLWLELGWDVGCHAERLGLKHGSQAAARMFPVPHEKPTGTELDWFRAGFAFHRQGKSRPTTRG